MYRKSRVSVTCIMHIIISWIVILSTLLTTVLTAAAHTTAPYDPAPVTTERVPAAAPITAPDDPAPVTTERATTLPITPPEVPATVTSARAPAITAAPASLPAPVPYGPVNAPSAPQSNPIAQAAYSDVLGQNDAAYHIAADERGGWQANTLPSNINNAFIGKQSSTNKRYPWT